MQDRVIVIQVQYAGTNCLLGEVRVMNGNFLRHVLFVLTSMLFALPSPAQRLPTGQWLTPPQGEIALSGTLPLGVAAVAGTSRVVVSCSGALQGLAVVDMRARKQLSFLPFQALAKNARGEMSYTPTGSAFYGVAVSPDGQTVYAAQGSMDTIGIFRLAPTGALTQLGVLADPGGNAKTSSFPSGVALSPEGTRLYAANNLSDSLSVFDVPRRMLLGRVPVGGYPLAVAALPRSAKVYVACEQSGTVAVVNPLTLQHTGDIATGSHPDALCVSRDGQRLYVANAGSDTVSVVDTRTDLVLRTLLLRPAQARGLPGTTPTALALAPDERTLFVTLADMNAVAVVRLNLARTDGALRGLLSCGWYPSAVCALPAASSVCIINAKGARARTPNPNGPGPTGRGLPTRYIHNLLTGTALVMSVPTANALAAQTRQVLADNSVRQNLDPDAPQVARALGRLPIKHVLYIIKENRTYDQVLGDVPTGSGDPSLTLFGRGVTPNLHALAEQFVLLDNCYACAEVSADGWNWSTSGFANDYVQRTVPENYSEKGKPARPNVRSYDYEGENGDDVPSLHNRTDVSQSPGGYLWDAVARAGLPLRNYGCFLTFSGDHPTKPALAGATSPDFAPFNMKHADSDAWVSLGLAPPGQGTARPGGPPVTDEHLYGPNHMPSRYTAWKREFDSYVKHNNLPAFEIIRLPRDHTAATSPGMDTPQAMAADNDYAVGELVQAVSHSPFWQSTAIFVIEDDAQNGPDHIDCHRTTAYVVSPFIKRRTVDHHFYNTDSLLRTMELLLHLAPMTRYDAVAPPLRAFTDAPNFAPFSAVLPDKTLLAQRNLPSAYGAAQSRRLDFQSADAAPDALMNDILWHSIKGRAAPLPAVRR